VAGAAANLSPGISTVERAAEIAEIERVAVAAEAERAIATAAFERAAATAEVERVITLRSMMLSPASPRQQRLAASFGTATGWANEGPADSLPTAYQTLGELLAEAGAAQAGAVHRRQAAVGSPALSGGAAAGDIEPSFSERQAGGFYPGMFEAGLPLVLWPSAGMSANDIVRSAEAQRWVAAATSPSVATRLVASSSGDEILTSAAAGIAGISAAGALGVGSSAGSALSASSSGTSALGASSFAGDPTRLSDAEFIEPGTWGSMERGALAPGMVAQRALGFGAMQSSQAADLSYDFVPPELVLAARVYGFGAAEAAQAARLAVGGSAGLSAMAGAVDLRFVALASLAAAQAGASSRDALRAEASAASSSAASSPAAASASSSTSAASFRAAASASAPATLSAALSPTAQAEASVDAAFGVARRMPRGAFLFPSASVSAMGLSAALPEGEYAMPIAALEILAAKMVAELGSFASPMAPASAAPADVQQGGTPATARTSQASQVGRGSTPAMPTLDARGASPNEASEAAVLSSVSATVGQARRARFEALYIALAETSVGRTMSPAARAARALALTNRDEDAGTLSSRERAALAWQIFPVVLQGDGAAPADAAARSTSEGTARSGGQGARVAPDLSTMIMPAAGTPASRPGAEMRPGLGPLSARAGEALSSFVSSPEPRKDARGPAAAASGDARASWRSGRYGGGEAEIPAWFEAAARKMFEDRGEVDGISLSDLTLVSAVPPTQVAAASRGETPAAVPPKQASPDGKGEKGQKVDIEKVAAEVYRAVMQLMDSARMRNGEPYL
jgi:hypothetical protein